MENMQQTDVSNDDPLFQSTRWLKPSSELIYQTYQAPGPGISISILERFRGLPKPLAWSGDNSREKDPPKDSAEWERMWSNAGLDSLLRNEEGSPMDEWKTIQARPILDLKALVSRSYVPVSEDGPRPLRLWQKTSAGYDRTSSTVDEQTLPLPVPDYEYTGLVESDEIRILDLLPGQGTEPLAFNLRSGHLNNPRTNYEALSYVWGTEMVDVVCNGNRFSFPQSLYRALVSLRDPTQVRSVWADAICINQGDDQEKSRQVRMMRKIFRQAHRVLIWLDERDAHVAQVAFDLASRVHQGQLQNVPPPQSPIWGVFIRLFDKEWFGRIWCLQEVVLASSALVIWGTATAPWEHIGFSAGWLCHIGYEVLSIWMAKVRPYRGRADYHPGVYRASLMYSLWSAFNNDAALVSFYDLLCQTRLFEATDPRDKVFALIGIPTTDADPEESQYFVEPDYSKSAEEIFVDVAKRILARAPASLHLLGAVQHQRYYYSTPSVKVPTWVPNWTVFCSRSLVPSAGYKDGLLPESRPVRTDGSALIVSGLIVDTVKYAERLVSRDYLPSLCYFLSSAWTKITELLDVYPGGADMGEAFCWTITAGNNWLGQRVTATDRAQHMADYEAFRKQYCAEYSFPVLETPQDITHSAQPDARRYHEALCHACSNRCIFVTEKGYIGLGPGSMEQGTVVSLLSGAELPMILMESRPRSPSSNLHGHMMDNTEGDPASIESVMGLLDIRGEGPKPSFTVVGESYVYGIMDGQVGSNASDCKDIRLE